MAAGLPFYIFLGLVHAAYLPDILIHITHCDKLENAKSVLDNCLEPTIESKKLYMLIEGPKGDPYEFMQKRCSLRPAADNCLDSALETLKSCFNSTMVDGINVWKNLDNDIGDYVCKNNAKVASDLFQKTERSCWGKGVGEAIMSCATKLNIAVPLYDIPGIKSHCGEFGVFETCMKDTLGKYCPANVVEIEKTISQILTNHLCDKKK